MKRLSQEELYNLFESEERLTFKKRGRFLVRPAREGETILTIVAGKLETIKKAKKKDVVIRNIEVGSSAETYIIDEEKMKLRYILTPEAHTVDGVDWVVALAQGRVEAFMYLEPEPITFEAPWGEDMICYFEDFIARPIPGEPRDIYRIERATFDQTYEGD